MELTHTLFADDMLLMWEGLYENFQAFVEILEKYQKETWMVTNIEKLILDFNNLPDELLTRVRELFPFPLIPIVEGFKYLGFFLKTNDYVFQYWIWLF